MAVRSHQSFHGESVGQVAGADVSQTAATQGFDQRAPEWVQRQPHTSCPDCGGPNIVQGRCFECGYNEMQMRHPRFNGIPQGQTSNRGRLGGSQNVVATRQTAEGGANLQNFGVVTR